ncbi:MAG: hypothetical protein AAGA40_04290 [Cyanobacteria bacterium P01_E01_bin.45]
MRDRVCQHPPNNGTDVDTLHVKYCSSRYRILVLQLVLGVSRLQI